MEDRIVGLAGELTANYQWTIANRLSTTCPAASRYYLSNLEKSLINNPKLLKKEIKRSFSYCNHCGNLWQPGSYRIRMFPPPPKNNHIKKLLKWEVENPWRLNNRQKKKLIKFNESTSKIVYTCNVCQKTTKFSGLTKQPRSEKISFNAPVLKIGSKKGDLNAGLFIKTPNEKKSEEVQIQPVFKEQPTPESPMPSRRNTNIKFLNKPNRTPNLSMNSKTKNFKKGKSNLLAHILKQDQEPQKKNSLSSFLVSL